MSRGCQIHVKKSGDFRNIGGCFVTLMCDMCYGYEVTLHALNETCFIVTRLMHTQRKNVEMKKPNDYGGLVNMLPKRDRVFS